LSDSDDFYTDMQETATELLQEFSQGVAVLYRETRTDDSSDRPWDFTNTPDGGETLSGVVRPVTQQFVDGTRIIGTEDMLVFAVPTGAAPTISDRVLIDGRLRTPKKLRQLPDAGIPVVYFMVLED
jgi:hypothetical protein